MVASADTRVNKTAFVTGILGENPEANTRAVNEAWAERGHSGKISATLVQKLRSDLGLVGNIARRSRPVHGQAANGKARSAGRKRAAQPKPVKTSRATAPGGPARLLDELEKDFDRLIFKLMAAGGLGEAEDALRRVRRQVVRSLDA